MAIWGKQKYSTVKVKRVQIPDGRWLKCSNCNELIDAKAMEKEVKTCPRCKFHFKMSAWERIELMIDEGTFVEWADGIKSVDSLGFTGKQSYIDKLESNQKQTGWDDAISVGGCRVGEQVVISQDIEAPQVSIDVGGVLGIDPSVESIVLTQ